MKRAFLLVVPLILVITSCNSNKIEVDRISINPTVINPDLATNFPRELCVDENYFYTPTMIADYAIGIYDILSGEMVSGTVKIGKGPEEFITPKLKQIYNGNIFISDVNKKQLALFPLDHAVMGKYECQMLPKSNVENYTDVVMVDKDNLVFLQPIGNKLFQHVSDKGIAEFGEMFLDVEEREKYTFFQGEIAYHKKKKKLVYGNFFVPYISIHDFKKGSFFITNEKVELDRTLDIAGAPKYDKKKRGIRALTLTKDYIVCIQRDYETDPTDESTVGRDFSKLCKTVFLYDFNNQLISIVDLEYPVLRIASTQDKNEFIAVIFCEDRFQVVKYYIPEAK